MHGAYNIKTIYLGDITGERERVHPAGHEFVRATRPTARTNENYNQNFVQVSLSLYTKAMDSEVCMNATIEKNGLMLYQKRWLNAIYQKTCINAIRINAIIMLYPYNSIRLSQWHNG